MFVDATLNGKPMKRMMIDTSATHNFVSKVEAKRLGLKLKKDIGYKKAINSKAMTTTGVSQTNTCKDQDLGRDYRLNSCADGRL